MSDGDEFNQNSFDVPLNGNSIKIILIFLVVISLNNFFFERAKNEIVRYNYNHP